MRIIQKITKKKPNQYKFGLGYNYKKKQKWRITQKQRQRDSRVSFKPQPPKECEDPIEPKWIFADLQLTVKEHLKLSRALHFNFRTTKTVSPTINSKGIEEKKKTSHCFTNTPIRRAQLRRILYILQVFNLQKWRSAKTTLTSAPFVEYRKYSPIKFSNSYLFQFYLVPYFPL